MFCLYSVPWSILYNPWFSSLLIYNFGVDLIELILSLLRALREPNLYMYYYNCLQLKYVVSYLKNLKAMENNILFCIYVA